MLTPSSVKEKIDSIAAKLPQFKFAPELLAKFSDSEEDRLFLSYVNGVGGGYVKFLYLLVKELGLKKAVELGNREGLSTLSIYGGLPADGKFITIDLVKDQRYCPEAMFKDQRVEFVFGDVCDLSIFKNGVPLDIDFLFTDTIHFDFQLRDEFEIYQHLLADRALIAIDDINLNDKRKLFDELPFAKWDLTELCHVSGWGLILFERKEKLTAEERLLAAHRAAAKIWQRKYSEVFEKIEAIESRRLKNRTLNFLKRHPALWQGTIRVKKSINRWRG